MMKFISKYVIQRQSQIYLIVYISGNNIYVEGRNLYNETDFY
jgi:hypothetical protein